MFAQWKGATAPDMVFDVMRCAADNWLTLELADETHACLRKRQAGDANGKLVKGGEPMLAGARLKKHRKNIYWSCD